MADILHHTTRKSKSPEGNLHQNYKGTSQDDLIPHDSLNKIYEKQPVDPSLGAPVLTEREKLYVSHRERQQRMAPLIAASLVAREIEPEIAARFGNDAAREIALRTGTDRLGAVIGFIGRDAIAKAEVAFAEIGARADQ